MTDKTMVSTSMDDMLETINRTYKSAYKAGIDLENFRCVSMFEAKAEEARKIGESVAEQFWISTAETIRIRDEVKK